MVVSYIRPDKDFEGVYEQLKCLNAYALDHAMVIHEELIDQTSQSKRLHSRGEAVRFFHALRGDTLLVYDTWVLSSCIEDVVQILSCLFKNDTTIHLIKSGVVVTRHSDSMVILGLMDRLRQLLYANDKKTIGRPRGSKSSSKFDIHLDTILTLLKEGHSVSEIARVLDVSRSSLKDYIGSRELKELLSGMTHRSTHAEAEAMVISTIRCPITELKKGV